MTTLPLIDNAHCTLVYHPKTQIVHHRMHGYMPTRQFEEMLLAGAEAMRTHGGCKWLSDDRKNPVIAPSRQEWARANWFPKVLAIGWKYWAIVTPTASLGQWSTGQVAEMYGRHGIVTQFFSEPDAAMQWLEQQT